MRRSWLAWALTTFFMVLYVAVARVESQSTRVQLELRPGNEIELTVFRAFDERLSAGLSYRNECVLLPDGVLSPFGNGPKEVPGFLVFTPAPLVRLEVSNGDSKPLTYEAMPDRNCGPSFRRLTTNLSIAPGVYRQPPLTPVQWISLDRYRNDLRIKVAEVDPQVLGRTVELAVLAPLGFKTLDASLFFFWFAFFLEPVFWVTQSIWLLSLLAQSRRSFAKKAV
jgi:hypothetical protein